MDTAGYCTISKNATTGMCDNLESFLGKDCRVMEFASDGGVLVINAESTELAMFDKVDVVRKFECTIQGDVICPPNMDIVSRIMYFGKVTSRKGGYNNVLRNMVIQASLMKGKHTDGFLFQKEREEQEMSNAAK